ncbi:MAG: carbon monoxide dehydrogenase [Syntrophus sp. GWC2_56_31]|nr:MAG: carbon monoxide dehydrogenase [Syntrophus sp. GWC2_56_31]
MSFTIAVSGKGGTGKTTFAGMVVRYLLEKGKGPVLAVDADANMNLNEVLGIDVKTTIGEMREAMKEEVPAGMTKDVWFEYKVQEALTEAKGFDLLAMGRPEGAGCYCAANTLARKYIDLLSGNYPYIVIDNEAGMEHFSRLTTQDVDLLFILSDSSRRSIITAGRIRDLIKELKSNIVKEVLVLNRMTGPLEGEISEVIREQHLDLAGVMPVSEEIGRYDRSGMPTFGLPLSAPAVQAAWRIFDQYIP